jgi:hypothetical protein
MSYLPPVLTSEGPADGRPTHAELREVATVLADAPFGILPVVDGGDYLGAVTARDLGRPRRRPPRRRHDAATTPPRLPS